MSSAPDVPPPDDAREGSSDSSCHPEGAKAQPATRSHDARPHATRCLGFAVLAERDVGYGHGGDARAGNRVPLGAPQAGGFRRGRSRNDSGDTAEIAELPQATVAYRAKPTRGA